MSASPMDPLRILIVARHCGEVGSGGSRRPLLMAQALDRAGHQVTVVTPFDCPTLPEVWKVSLSPNDLESNTAQNEPQIARPQIPKTGLQSLPRRLLPGRLMALLRRWRYFPDMEILWARTVEEYVSAQQREFDWVITTSPPESLHFVGHRLAKRLKAKWCADLRDAWLENPHRPHVGFIRRFVERMFARRNLSRANAMVTIDGDMEREFRSYAPDTGLLRLGHFSERYDGPLEQLPSEKFNLVHAGAFSFSDHRRRLHTVLEDLARIGKKRTQNGLPGLHFHIIGRLSDEESEACAIHNNRDLEITSHGATSLEKSRAFQQAADGLLLYSPETSRSLPGKLAEYAISHKPIFLMGQLDTMQAADLNLQLNPVESLEAWDKGSDSVSEVSDMFDADKCILKLIQFLRSI